MPRPLLVSARDLAASPSPPRRDLRLVPTAADTTPLQPGVGADLQDLGASQKDLAPLWDMVLEAQLAEMES